MQPSASPPPPPDSRRRIPLLLAIGAVVLLALGGVVGYLVGSAPVGHATLRVSVENRFTSTVTAPLTVNARVVATLVIPSTQTMSVDVPVVFGTADGAVFAVETSAPMAGRDSSSVLVNSPGIYIVSLRLG
jgi:hypothetical protein